MSVTSTIPARRATPDLEHRVPGWRVELHRAHAPALGFGALLAGTWAVAPANVAENWWFPTFMASAWIAMAVAIGVLGGARCVLRVSDGLVHVMRRDQDVDPRRSVAAVDRLERSARRGWDPLVTVLLGHHVVRQRGERTPLWIPVAWISRRQLDAFLDEAERIAARA